MTENRQVEIELPEEIIPTKSKLAFGGATLSSGILSGIVFGAITFFYNVKLGLPEFWVGLGWLIFMAWNAINDPLFGYIEDNTKSEKYGRRIPYLRFGAPIYTLCFIICWFPLVDLNDHFALFLNFVIVLYLFDSIFTIVGLITYSLPAEMAITSKARTNLMVFGGIFMALGLLLSFAIPILLLTGAETPELNPAFQPTMVVVGITCGLMLFASSYYITENKYTQMEESLGLFEGIKETLKNKSFLIFEVSNFTFLLGQTILTTAVFYYIEYILRLSGFMSLVPVLLFFLMVLLFIPIYAILLRKIELKKLFIIGLGATGLSFFVFFFIGWFFASAVVGMLFLGMSFASYFLMGQMVFADIIDKDEMLTGKRRETTYSGTNALLTKPAGSIAPWLFLTIISFYGFDAEAITQGPSAQLGIMLAFTIIPAIFLFISAFSMVFFPLAGPEWKKQKEQLAKIHEEKEKSYLKYLTEKEKL